MPQPPRIRITKRELQDKFNKNEGGYPARLSSLRKERTYCEDAHPNSNQVPGTKSIIEVYYDGEVSVAAVHFFLQPDGQLGASGKLDPQYLVVDGVRYFI
jgi:hypothetical protein